MGETDVFVLPSFAEGVPVTLMEAMGSAIPVVATQVGGVGELVEDGTNGFIVRPGDEEQLADRLIELVADSDLRRQFGAAGREKVLRDFANDSEAGRLEVLFTNALAGLPSPLRPELPS